MPVSKCPNGKWKIGSGDCVFDSKEKAEAAYKAYLAKKHDSKNEIEIGNSNIDTMIENIDKEITELYEMSSVLYSIKNIVEFFKKRGT